MQHDLEVFSEAIHIDSGPALRKPPLDFVSGRSGKSEDISLMKRRGKIKYSAIYIQGQLRGVE